MEHKTKSVTRHNLSARYPEDKTVINRLISSMLASGFNPNHPITTYEGKILDGWHRYRAAQIANVTPVLIDFAGSRSQALEFVFSENCIRRHLSKVSLCVAYLDLAITNKAKPDDAVIMSMTGASASTLSTAKKFANIATESERHSVAGGEKKFSDADPQPRQTMKVPKSW